MAVYAVGDIQGCMKALKKLLKQVRFDARNDVLWCVGDLVNRGPKPLETLHFLRNPGDVLDAPDCDELIEWLRQKPPDARRTP